MPYCRRCGAKLEEDARFCHKCGTPVIVTPPPQMPTPPPEPAKPIHKDPLILGGIALIAILVVAVVAIAFLVAPMGTWGLNQSLEDKTANVNTLNLNFQTNVGKINIVPIAITGNNVGIYLQANGSRSAFGGNGNPVSVSFDNQTVGDTLTVDSKVTVESRSLMRGNVEIQIFVNPALNLNLNVTTDAGSITLGADQPATFQSINLQTKAGTVEATMHNATITGDLSFSTNAGSVYLGMSQNHVEGNRTVSVQSNAGSVSVDITQTKSMNGNLQVNANTNLGSINVGLEVDGAVAAKLTSQTSLGTINVENARNFSGDQTPLRSNNYPAASNIEINSTTNLGSININADYLSGQSSNLMHN